MPLKNGQAIKKAPVAKGTAENIAREEIPMFMAILAVKIASLIPSPGTPGEG